MEKKLLRAAETLFTTVAIVFVPRVAVEATQLFNIGVQLTTHHWGGLSLAGLMLLYVFSVHSGKALSNCLTSMLAIFQGLLLVSAASIGLSKAGVNQLAWSGSGFALMLFVRLCSRTKDASRLDEFASFDLGRLALACAISAGFVYGNGGSFANDGLIVVAAVVASPFVVLAVRPYLFGHEGRNEDSSSIACSRWTILSAMALFLLSLSWAQGRPSTNALALMAVFGMAVWKAVPDLQLSWRHTGAVAGAYLATVIPDALSFAVPRMDSSLVVLDVLYAFGFLSMTLASRFVKH